MSGHPNERQVAELEVVVRDLNTTRNKILTARSMIAKAEFDIRELSEQERELFTAFKNLLTEMDITPGNAGFEGRMICFLDMYKVAVTERLRHGVQ